MTADASAALAAAYDDALGRADDARRAGRGEDAWRALERAHLLGQHRFGWHLRAHLRMLGLALDQADARQIAGQLLRIVLVPVGHFLDRLPAGNPGSSRVGPFAVAPLPADVAALLPAPRARPRVWPAFLLVALVVAADQGTKALVASLLPPGAIVVVAANFNLVHVTNPGAAFSLFADAGGWQRPALVALGIVVSLWLGREIALGRTSPRERTGYALIVGGALGNTWDRVRQGAVTDFLDVHARDLHWPTFNGADIALNLGVALVLFALLRPGRDPASAEHPA